ncbi:MULTISPECIES: LmbU family transcriptional regulator [unclassified Streptomyces]|uniref:LmbU family transcriptional regulator n=1 Tax=unclassified Streptomyces TaxID=2593676 RepID=UPI00344D3BF6
MVNTAGVTDLRRAPTPPLNAQALTRRTGLLLPPDFSLTDWKRFGRHLFLISDSSSWWLGDWLLYGQDMYPDRYRQAILETGLDYKTLRNYAWVARRFPVTERHTKLSFQHHAEVASLEPAERGRWLERAAREDWSRNALRQHMRQALSGPDGERKQEVRLQVRVSSEQESKWATAAERAGRDLAEWIVHCLDQAADLKPAPGS